MYESTCQLVLGSTIQQNEVWFILSFIRSEFFLFLGAALVYAAVNTPISRKFVLFDRTKTLTIGFCIIIIVLIALPTKIYRYMFFHDHPVIYMLSK